MNNFDKTYKEYLKENIISDFSSGFQKGLEKAEKGMLPWQKNDQKEDLNYNVVRLFHNPNMFFDLNFGYPPRLEFKQNCRTPFQHPALNQKV